MNSTNMAAGKTAATTLSEQHGEIVERLLKLYSILDTRKLEGDDRDYWLISREIAWENYQLAALYAKMHGALGDVTTV